MPTNQEIQDRLVEIVCKQLGVAKEKITASTSFVNDLGADSLDTVELIMEMEETFGLSIPDEDAEKIQTVTDAVKYIENALATKV
ncbi:MAG: acyl carrier protein [Planctomycetota bacterium]|nr:acyl carrier protein [Planctomycetota bacterium]